MDKLQIDMDKLQIATFDPPLLEALKETYKPTSEYPDFNAFLKYLGSPAANAQLPAPETDLDRPLASYFISTSHNTYLTGNQLYGNANVDGYKSVSELTGGHHQNSVS
jgi:hypothetical protein